MSLTLAQLGFLTALFALFFITAYYFKNIYILLCASMVCFIIAASMYGGILIADGNTITQIGDNYLITATYTPINLGFNTIYLAFFFVITGLFLFIQGFGSVLQKQLVTPT